MAELAFDLGQTQTRVRLITERGDRANLELDGFRYGSDTIQTILDRCRHAAATFGVTEVRTVAGGGTGLYGAAPPPSALRASLSASLGVERVIIADDAVTSHLGALAGEPGTLIAAGTGIVGLGIGPAGAARVDGVGSLIGDDGSPRLLEALEHEYGPAADVPSLIIPGRESRLLRTGRRCGGPRRRRESRRDLGRSGPPHRRRCDRRQQSSRVSER